MTNVKAGFIILTATAISFIFSTFVGGIYDRYFPSEYGIEVFFLGFVLTFYLVNGLIYGLFYKVWHKNKILLFESIILILYFLWYVVGDSEAWFFLVSLASGYILGFILNKLRMLIKGYMIREVQKSERK